MHNTQFAAMLVVTYPIKGGLTTHSACRIHRERHPISVWPQETRLQLETLLLLYGEHAIRALMECIRTC